MLSQTNIWKNYEKFITMKSYKICLFLDLNNYSIISLYKMDSDLYKRVCDEKVFILVRTERVFKGIVNWYKKPFKGIVNWYEGPIHEPEYVLESVLEPVEQVIVSSFVEFVKIQT